MLKEQVKQWEQEAIQKGIEQGIEQGKAECEAGVLLRLLENKFGPLSDELRWRIDEAGSEQLLTWAERILTVERIKDVFEDE